MTIMVPNAGEGLALKNFVNNEAPQDQTLKLFTNNITPAETDTAGTYTEAAGGGYAAKSLTGASWTLTEGAPSDVTNSLQTWTFTGALTGSATVYGYFVVQATSGTIMWSELAATPFQPLNSGDEIKITPKITAD